MQLKTKDMNVRGRLFGAVIWIIGFCLLSVVHNTVYSQTITPFQYGLKDAQTPEDIYRVLLRTHQAADSCGAIVSYAGIDTLRIAIPADAQSIPLQKNNDFGGVVFIVNNSAKELFLFQYSPAAEPIIVHDTLSLCHAIDSGNFMNILDLAEGDWLLRIVDSTPWVDRRRGYQYGHYREDIMILHNGISYDTTAMPYSFGGSRPTLFARRLDSVDTCPFSFGNIILMREQASTFATYLVQLENLPQASLRNIVVVTPHSDKLAGDDAIIYIYNSANVSIDSLTIWGTYSRLNHSGYGLLLGNLRNTHIRRLKALTDWGVFGTNNLTETTIEYSEFNRFDIHCYGRDVTFEHCLLRNGYNQFSSVFGTIAFSSCTFDNFTPVFIEDTYNAYTNFLLYIDNCRWYPTAKRYVLFDGGNIDSPLNSRMELQSPALPNIFIGNLDVFSKGSIRHLELFHLKGNERHAHTHQAPERILLQNVIMHGNPSTKLILSNKKVNLTEEVKLETMDDTIYIERLTPTVINIK